MNIQIVILIDVQKLDFLQMDFSGLQTTSIGSGMSEMSNLSINIDMFRPADFELVGCVLFVERSKRLTFTYDGIRPQNLFH